MHALKLIKQDHQNVNNLFKEYNKLDEEEYVRKKEIFDEIKNELELHAKAEEKIFYPTLGRKDSKILNTKLIEARAEHEKVKIFLKTMSLMKADNILFDPAMERLQKNVLHHVKEEERDIFKLARKTLNKPEMDQMGLDLEEFKENER